jgi:hypothetical protein
MIPVRQSTAFETSIGPVLDADGVAFTGAVVGDFEIKKNGGNWAALNGSATLTHTSVGDYDLVLTTSDLDTVGVAAIRINDTVNACATLYLQVIEEAVYDALYAASAPGYVANQPVDLNTIKTQTVTCAAGVTVLASVGTAATSTAQTGDAYAIVNSGTHGNAALLARTPAAAAITNMNTVFDTDFAANYNTTLDAWDVNVVGWLGTAPATPTVAGVPEVDLTHSAGVAVTNSDFTIASATASTVTLPTTYTNGDSLPDDDRYVYTAMSVVGGTGSGQIVLLTTAAAGARQYNVLSGTMPVQLDATSTCVMLGSQQATQATLTTASINAAADQVWEETLTDHSGTAGSTAAALNAAGSAGDPWATALPGAYGAGTAGRMLGRSLPDIVAGSAGGLVIAGSNAATTFAGLTTGALACTTITASGAVAFQSTFAVTTSTALAALSCTTLTASGAVALQSTVTVTGATTFTGAITATNASNNLRLGTFTVDTNAMAWNASWDAEIESEATDALNAYDSPTNAEMEARTIAAASYATASALSSLVTTVGVAGAGLTAVPWNASWDAEVQSEVQDALDGTIADSIPADGTRPSVSSGIYMMTQLLVDCSISGTTMTVRKPDGSTTLFTITLNDATTPTSKTRAT